MVSLKSKEGVPLRPIDNILGSPTYEIAKYVAKMLGPIVGKSDMFRVCAR